LNISFSLINSTLKLIDLLGYSLLNDTYRYCGQTTSYAVLKMAKIESYFNHYGHIKMYKLLSALFLSLSLCSCAYVVNSKLVKIPVVTTPDGATITVNNDTYTSPATILLPRGTGNYKLHIEKQGFKAVDIDLTQSIDIAFAGNAISFGPVGLAVDFITGYAYDLEPDMIEANLDGTKITKLDDGALHLVLVDINELPEHVALQIKQSAKLHIK